MVEEVLEAGRRAYPALAPVVSREQLERFLAARPQAQESAAADLFLTCACVLGERAALEAFDAQLLSQVPGWVSRVDPSADFGRDVAQRLREQLLGGTPPGVDTFVGRGSLEGWVRVSAVRLALKLSARRPDEAPLAEARSPGFDPSDQLARLEASAEVGKALEAVLRDLSPEQRAWLKLYYLDGCTLEQIARIFRVHVSTISRRLSALDREVLATLRKRLEEQLRLPPGEVDSLIRFVRSQLEVSLNQALKEISG